MGGKRPVPDVIVIGGGVIGAACAYYCSLAGLSVTVIERGALGGATTAACEGNILLSDKRPGAELHLQLQSARLWRELADEFGSESLEYDSKGGVVVAADEDSAAALAALTAEQRSAGIAATDVTIAQLLELEPNINPDVHAGAFYPQDSQVQPTLATALLLQKVRDAGGTILCGTTVVDVLHGPDGRVKGVRTDTAVLHAAWVVNAAGPWASQIAELAGAPIPVLPRRGFILVTEPLPRVIRHKVYTAEYVANVESSSEGLQTSTVVEGTAAGTVLIGASRERVGFDRTFDLAVIQRLAAGAIAVFPFLSHVSLLRTYLGFRPYCPDHLPIVGADPRAAGLIHAAGHEGTGIGLAPATGQLVAQLITGAVTDVDIEPFRPDRFEEVLT